MVPTFQTTGSVEQVYVTGLAPCAGVAPHPAGQTLKTQNANSLGGLLFRNVTPRRGLSVTPTLRMD